MSEKKNTEEHFHPDETGILKSVSSGPQRMSEFVNSAVSESAVARAEVGIQKNEVYVGAVPEAAPDEVFIGQTADTVVLPEQKVEALQETLAKADALVESFEQRQAKLTEVYDQAEKMLEEVSRIKEALTFDNKLRERIEATIARTKNLRRGVQR
jgi:ABC-type enterochelin transport system substrate-binding protein